MSIDAYGDESAGTGFVAYGTLLLPTESREAVETQIAKLKIEYGASAADYLHCRVLFSGEAAHLDHQTSRLEPYVENRYKSYVDIRLRCNLGKRSEAQRGWATPHQPVRSEP